MKVKNIEVSGLEIEIWGTLTNYFAEYNFIQTALKSKVWFKPTFLAPKIVSWHLVCIILFGFLDIF